MAGFLIREEPAARFQYRRQTASRFLQVVVCNQQNSRSSGLAAALARRADGPAVPFSTAASCSATDTLAPDELAALGRCYHAPHLRRGDLRLSDEWLSVLRAYKRAHPPSTPLQGSVLDRVLAGRSGQRPPNYGATGFSLNNPASAPALASSSAPAAGAAAANAHSSVVV